MINNERYLAEVSGSFGQRHSLKTAERQIVLEVDGTMGEVQDRFQSEAQPEVKDQAIYNLKDPRLQTFIQDARAGQLGSDWKRVQPGPGESLRFDLGKLKGPSQQLSVSQDQQLRSSITVSSYIPSELGFVLHQSSAQVKDGQLKNISERLLTETELPFAQVNHETVHLGPS